MEALRQKKKKNTTQMTKPTNTREPERKQKTTD